MIEPSHPDQTVDESVSTDPLDAGLAAAFGPESGPPPAPGASVLKALAASLPAVPRVHLREPPQEPDAPVSRPGSDELPDSAGRYQFIGEIARGGMGAILKGRDTDLGRDVAVKVLLETHRNQAELVQRFVEEAQVGGQLQHPGIVPVYELGQFPDRRPYFTMKLVKGRTLAALLAARCDPAEDLPRFLGIFEQVCQTLAYAHARGVLHRDLKPSNVMVGAFGEVQVMDWGLAKVLAEGGVADEEKASRSVIRTVRSSGPETPARAGSQTHAGSVLGTPAYMAPEQARGEVDRIDERADVFGLGAILCEMLTGTPPYDSPSTDEAYRRAQQADLEEALARLGDCGADPELVQLARVCLAAEPRDRPRDAGVVARQVSGYLAGVQDRLRRAEVERVAAEARAAAERRARRLTVGLAAAVLALVTVGGGTVAWVAHDRARRQAEEEAQVRQRELRVNDLLQRANELHEQARTAPTEDRVLLGDALSAVRQAEALLADGPADDYLRRWAGNLARDLGEEERDRRMLGRLEQARLRTADAHGQTTKDDQTYFDYSPAAPEFAAAFRAYGIDVQNLTPAQATERLRARTIRTELAVGLDYWAVAEADPAQRQRLRDLARAVDDDPLRNRVREALQRNDGRVLQELAAGDRANDLPAPTLAQLALALRWAGAPAEAFRLLRLAQQRHPEDLWINHELASVLEQKRPVPWDEILRYHAITVALRPRSSGLHLNLARALSQMGRFDEAIASYRKALELDPNYDVAATWLASALIRKGDPDGAIVACRQAIHLRPDSYHAHNILADALRLKGRVKEAETACREAIRLKPEFAEAHNSLGVVFLLQDRLDEAVAAFQQALKLKPRAAIFNANLGMVLQQQGKRDEAIRAFQQATAPQAEFSEPLGLQPDIFFRLGSLLQEKGQRDEARAALQKDTQFRPGAAEGHYNLGLVCRDQGKSQEALAAFQRAAVLKPDWAEAQLNLGNAYVSEGKWGEAIAAFRKAVALNKDYAKAYQNLAYAYRKNGQPDEAVRAAETAIRLAPDQGRGYVCLGLALQDKGQFAEAAAALRRGHELGQKESDWTIPSGLWLRQAQRLADLDGKLAAVLGGEKKPATERERLALARFAQVNKLRSHAAVRLWEDAFAARPGLVEDLRTGYRYNAACAAGLAGCGRGEDAGPIDDRERRRCRQLALDWLRADLTLAAGLLAEGDADDGAAVGTLLQQWQANADLAGLRDPAALARLPAEEQQTWRKLWDDVEALRRQAR